MFSVSKFTVLLALVGGLLVLAFVLTKKDTLEPKGILRGLFEQIYLFIRDEMVYPTMGEKAGKRFLPFFCTIFTLIITLNLVGLIPIPKIGGAVASTLGFTLPMALIVLLVGVVGGIMFNGHGFVGFLNAFIPPGLPKPIIPLIFLLEIVGYLIKHGVLAVVSLCEHARRSLGDRSSDRAHLHDENLRHRRRVGADGSRRQLPRVAGCLPASVRVHAAVGALYRWNRSPRALMN